MSRSGVKRQTITKWTHPEFDRYPDLEALAQVATALGVPTAEIVAAMDGEGPLVVFDDRMRAMIREEIAAYGREHPQGSDE